MKSNTKSLALVVLASAFAAAAWAQELGRVHFETSCTPQAQERFDRGLAMVHSFVYPDSVQAFTDAAAADPQCAIAYWGIAISSRPNPLVLPLSAATPMRELLGDLLMAQQLPAQALTEYEAALLSTPNRLRGLYGAAKAAEAVGQLDKATDYFRKLAELTKEADAGRSEIREAKAFLARR